MAPRWNASASRNTPADTRKNAFTLCMMPSGCGPSGPRLLREFDREHRVQLDAVVCRPGSLASPVEEADPGDPYAQPVTVPSGRSNVEPRVKRGTRRRDLA